MAFRPPSGGGGFVNPMPLDTFLQGTRSDAQAVNLIGVSDDFGNEAIYVGDFQYNTPLLFVQSDGFVSGVRFMQFTDDAITIVNENGGLLQDEMIVDFNRGSKEFQYKYETITALLSGITHKYEAYSDLAGSNDILHTIEYKGYDDTQIETVYAGAQVTALNVVTGSAQGQYSIRVQDSGLYSPMVFTGARRIDVSLTAGATSYTALYNEGSLTETITDNTSLTTILEHDTSKWLLISTDIGLGYTGVASFRADSASIEIDDGFGIVPRLNLDFNTPYFGLNSPFNFGMTLDIANNLIHFNGNVVFNDQLTTDAASSLGLFGASATGQLGPIADATGAGDVVARLNDLLAAMRTYGLLAP